MSDAEKAFFAKVEPSPSWFAIGLKFGFGFFTAAFLFSVIFGLLWVFFIGAILAGAAARHSTLSMPTPPAAPAFIADAPQDEKADSPTFAAPLSTLPPETPPVAPEQEAPDAASPDFNKWQHDHGLVLWKGEWVTPEERVGLRKAEDDAKTALNKKPRAITPDTPVPQNNAPVWNGGQALQFNPRFINPSALSSRPEFTGPEGGRFHYSSTGKKVYDKR